MSEPLARDISVLRAALASTSHEVEVTLRLPRKSAQKVLDLLDAERTTGAVVIPVKETFTTTEAAAMLSISRPTLMKYIETGEISHVKVGTHHRIPAEALVTFQQTQRQRRDKAAQALAEFSNEIGLID